MGVDMSKDKFFCKGQQIMAAEHADQSGSGEAEGIDDETRDIRLLEGKIKREVLKKDLFSYLASVGS